MAFNISANAFKRVFHSSTDPCVRSIIQECNSSRCNRVYIYPKKGIIESSTGYTFKFYPTTNEILLLQRSEAIEDQNLRSITAGALLSVLKVFIKEVESNKNARLTYNDWRNLVQFAKRDPEQEISFWENLDVDTSEFGFGFYDETNKDGFFIEPPSSLFANILYLYSSFVTRYEKYNQKTPEVKTEKENNKTMNMPTMKFDFGPVNSDRISLSPYGMAVITPDGSALTYNPASGQTVDVTGFTFDFKGMIYKVPTAVSQIQTGDMIMHNGKPMYVTGNDGANIDAIDILESEAKTVIPITNMFGFNFVTKVVSFLNFGNTTPSPDQPFGNLMPIMMASMVFGDNKGDSPFNGKDMDFGKMMMLSALMGGNAGVNPLANLFNFNPNSANQ